ncbi:DUF4191 domain-containing protein [Micrococcus sp.]|uniref:DUF4191 domain-containing protein n=1 Tax=Micrococcus sp. TaxID=1271 RepID=UPI002A91EDA1|nr:DUF4191 domain-containing protein [Micrococcus sp.]MDY6055539.1 DUF4191 domain-containing protein [Micrococcus sp.]
MAKNSSSPTSNGSSSTSLKEVKAMQRERRRQVKADARAQRRARRASSGPGVISSVKQIYGITREAQPRTPLYLAGTALAVLLVFLVIGLLLNNWITWLLIGIPFAVLAAVIVLNRMGQRAMYGRLEGQTGSAGAAISQLGRGWIVSEQPVAMNPRTRDVVFRAIGRPGVVLVTEGPSTRVARLLQKEERDLRRFLPGVPVHVVETGRGENQTPLPDVVRTIKAMPKKLTANEVATVDKRLSAITSQRPPIPKGVDPMRARPDRRGLRGR